MLMNNERHIFAEGVAVITGAGSGIGAGIARRVGALGMHVVVTDIVQERADSVASEIHTKGGQAEALRLDVSDPEALDALAQYIFARHGAVRLLVNNAGIETLGYIWEIPLERWEATLNINIHGVVHGVRAFVPYMLKCGEESWIANVASIGAFGSMPTQTPYMMSKHAVQSLSECLYLELQMVGAPIHVSSVIPGMLKTNIFSADAGHNEPEGASRHRKTMYDLMMAHGMDLDEGCLRIVEQIAQCKFWVSSQPDMTADMVASRVAFLNGQLRTALTEQTRQLLGV